MRSVANLSPPRARRARELRTVAASAARWDAEDRSLPTAHVASRAQGAKHGSVNGNENEHDERQRRLGRDRHGTRRTGTTARRDDGAISAHRQRGSRHRRREPRRLPRRLQPRTRARAGPRSGEGCRRSAASRTPRATARLMRALGAREISNGIAILSRQQPEKAIWSRVAGDALDLALLGKVMANPENDRGRALFATANVLAVTALDVMCAKQLSMQPQHRRERGRGQGDHPHQAQHHDREDARRSATPSGTTSRICRSSCGTSSPSPSRASAARTGRRRHRRTVGRVGRRHDRGSSERAHLVALDAGRRRLQRGHASASRRRPAIAAPRCASSSSTSRRSASSAPRSPCSGARSRASR